MASGIYEHQAIEKKWQEYWLKNKTFKSGVDASKPKYYVLDMFPYPSGDGLHVGHPEGYTATDILSRYRRMKGFNVLHPMGWDAFGLPAERHAVRTGEHPAAITNRNCENFRRQLQALGFSYDWDREINTTDPKYYRWTQWIFEILFERGLAYQIEAPVNWCPALGTVLANEEVKDGLYVETGDPVEKRMMRQWMLRITSYAERLLEDLEGLDWPEGIKAMQREWIGRSEGADVRFKVADSDAEFTVFTTRPDTLFGATYCVLAPEHSLTLRIATAEQRPEVEAYIAAAASRSAQDRMKAEREKTGVFTGAYAINPVNDERIPIWTADYVLAEYGYGAIMAVPAHDERDFEFARKFFIPIVQVVRPVRDRARSYLMGAEDIGDDELKSIGAVVVKTRENGHRLVEVPNASLPAYENLLVEKLTPGFWNEYLGDETVFIFKHKDGRIQRFTLTRENAEEINLLCAAFNNVTGQLHNVWTWLAENDWYTELVSTTDDGVSINSGFISGLPTPQAKKKITAWLEEQGIGKGTVNYRLRDWLFSRQRYWGEPFPLVTLEDGTVKAVPVTDLPVILPELAEYKPTADGRPPLARATEWVNTTDPETGKPATRETNTMPQWAGSCWYYLRFCDPGNEQQAWSPEAERYWMPIDLYLGGAEHAVLHLLYARFWHKVLFDAGYVTTKEPFQKLFNQGKILAYSFQDEKGKYYYPNQVERRGDQWVVKDSGVPVHTQIEKMSKSRYNVVNPDDVVREYGADSLRLYEMFMGPLERDKAWAEEGIQGVHRFLRRVWSLLVDENGALLAKISESGGDAATKKALHHAIKHVTEDIGNMQFNTAISRLMEFVNACYKAESLSRADVESFVLILSPFAPHIAEELWACLGHGETLAYVPWPDYDPALLVEDTIEVPVQVNGKLRGVLQAPTGADKDTLLAAAKQDEKIAQHLDGKTIVKEIVVPGKLVNFVVK